MANARPITAEAAASTRLRSALTLPFTEVDWADWAGDSLAGTASIHTWPLNAAAPRRSGETSASALAEWRGAIEPSGSDNTDGDASLRRALPCLNNPSTSPAAPQGPATTPATVPAGPAETAASAGWVTVTNPSGSPRLWRYVLPGQSADIDPGLETVVLIHGWLGSGVTSAPDSPLGFNPGFNTAAIQLASTNRQVLFLDWGQQALDPSPAGLAPYNAAGRINGVAEWARDPLLPLLTSGRTLTLVGFSLGSDVAAQTAAQLGSGSNLRLVALDPAASGLKGAYDLDLSNTSPDPGPNLATSSPFGSLAFVVADTNLSIGLAGDNFRAGTAQRSFVVRGFRVGTAAGDAHGAIPALYADLARYLAPNAAVTESILSGFRANQFNNSGGLNGIRLHEGVATVRNNQGAIARLEGYTAAGIAQTVQFVDSQDSLTPAGSNSRQDTLVTLRTLQLGSSASIERLVLGGNDAIGATGNGGAQELIGNAAANRLEGKGGLDRITGGDGGDTFVYTALSDALVGGSNTLRSFEWITDVDTSVDRIDAPGETLRSLSDLGSAGSLSDTGLHGLLTSGAFAAGSAALFRFEPGSGGGERLFLALNDSRAGFNPQRDAIIELTGLNGDPLSLVVS